MNNVKAFYQRFLRGLFARPKSRRVRRIPSSFTAPAHVEMLESRQMLTVTFHGGAVLQSVEAQAVYLGSDWQTTSSLTTQTGQFDTYLTTLVSGQYMDMLTNAGYRVGRGTSSTGAIDNISLSKTSGITDASIRSDIQAMINSNQLQTPDANRLYVVYVEPGVVVYNGSTSSVKVVNMTPATTYQFQVESVSRTGLRESNILTVNAAAGQVHALVKGHTTTEWQGAIALPQGHRKSNRG